MKTALLLSLLLCAASAAPAEDNQLGSETQSELHLSVTKNNVIHPDAAVEDPVEQLAPANVPEEAAAPESRFNFCPDGWFSQGSRCFLFVNTPMSWYSAEEHCNNLGANLASVSNPREYSFLQRLTQTATQSIAWLGGFNLQGRWMWIDREGFFYTNWYSPSSSSSFPCMYLRTSSGWGNTQCGSAHRFICSKNPFSC